MPNPANIQAKRTTNFTQVELLLIITEVDFLLTCTRIQVNDTYSLYSSKVDLYSTYVSLLFKSSQVSFLLTCKSRELPKYFQVK